MSKPDKDLTLQQLRAKHPETKAVSKKAFLLKLKKQAEEAQGKPERPQPPAPGKDTPKKPETPAKGPKKDDVPQGPGPTAEQSSGKKLGECAAKYKAENEDFIEEVVTGEEFSVLIAGGGGLYKVLKYRGKYGPTQTLFAARGKKLEEIRIIAKSL